MSQLPLIHVESNLKFQEDRDTVLIVYVIIVKYITLQSKTFNDLGAIGPLERVYTD